MASLCKKPDRVRHHRRPSCFPFGLFLVSVSWKSNESVCTENMIEVARNSATEAIVCTYRHEIRINTLVILGSSNINKIVSIDIISQSRTVTTLLLNERRITLQSLSGSLDNMSSHLAAASLLAVKNWVVVGEQIGKFPH